jgi:5'-3' exonuclease
MGIDGLRPLVHNEFSAAVREIRDVGVELRSLRVAVDVLIVLNRYIKGGKDSEIDPEDEELLLESRLAEELARFREAGITPLWVFDGPMSRPSKRRNEAQRRREQSQKTKSRIDELIVKRAELNVQLTREIEAIQAKIKGIEEAMAARGQQQQQQQQQQEEDQRPASFQQPPQPSNDDFGVFGHGAAGYSDEDDDDGSDEGDTRGLEDLTGPLPAPAAAEATMGPGEDIGLPHAQVMTQQEIQQQAVQAAARHKEEARLSQALREQSLQTTIYLSPEDAALWGLPQGELGATATQEILLSQTTLDGMYRLLNSKTADKTRRLLELDTSIRNAKRALMRPTDAHIDRTYNFLVASGCEVFTATYDAEELCAWLTRWGVVDAVVTEDSDALPFGATRVLFNWFSHDPDRGQPMFMVSLHKLLSATGLSMRQFQDACMLNKCDFLPTLNGISMQGALRLMWEYKSLPAILRALVDARLEYESLPPSKRKTKNPILRVPTRPTQAALQRREKERKAFSAAAKAAADAEAAGYPAMRSSDMKKPRELPATQSIKVPGWQDLQAWIDQYPEARRDFDGVTSGYHMDIARFWFGAGRQAWQPSKRAAGPFHSGEAAGTGSTLDAGQASLYAMMRPCSARDFFK